ncbi:hypothetical protein EUGRSUZ_C00286 [Eucalyptus grandis]|uniref:Uncharacterized protein n=2 Tax=Eucalyptus grandis TaxID=71139 RepID=A0A059CKC4_EUCGR|nr:hypothetical protein EUGRSUZ_C00286 [Eucalyptus grandis]
MKCKESRGQLVLPVLYKVKTKDVKHMLGKFGEAFTSSMHSFEEDVKQQGPLALRKTVDLRVFESEKFADGREGELINELIEIILREQQHDFQPHLPVNLVAIEDHVAEVMALVDLACPATRIIGIWGMGGIDIRKCHKSTVHDPEMGINMIRLSCEKKKVLILLDDVDHPNHLDNLIGGCKFLLGSRIIFTSRHKAINCQDGALLKSTYWYELKKMDFEKSLLLFSMHAFGKKPPPKPLVALSRDIVGIIEGLPSALTVIGSCLKGEEDQGIWGEMLEKLRNVPDEKVQQLRISYDVLEDDVKKLFLDIACFFIGINKRIAPYLWDHKLCPRTGLKKLIDRSLIYVDDEDELGMHDELRDLGKAIACPAYKKPWDCSRLWDEEAMIVLRRKVTIMSTFGISYVL